MPRQNTQSTDKDYFTFVKDFCAMARGVSLSFLGCGLLIFSPFPPALFMAHPPAPCAYDPGISEEKILCALDRHSGQSRYDLLIRAGFRRQEQIAYRSLYDVAGYCLPLRLCVQGFKMSKSTRRITNKNRDLTTRFRWVDRPGFSLNDRDYALFHRYQSDRHPGGGMARMSPDDFDAMIRNSPVKTALFDCLRPAYGGGEELIASCLLDQIADGFSAVYSYFSPAHAARSPGRYMIAKLIAETQNRNLPHLYLGYWMPSVRHMRYKSDFRPAEVFTWGAWQSLN